MKKIITLFSTLFLCTVLFSQNAYSPKMIKSFADSLYTQGFWDESESEYKRYFFVLEDHNIDETAVLNLAHIYFYQKDKMGISWLKNTFNKSVGFEVYDQLEYIKTSFTFLERDFSAFHLFYASLLEDTESLERLCPEWKMLYALSYEILQKNIKQAAQTANKAVEVSGAFGGIEIACEKYKQKSAGLAVSMSAFVPGSGKWYTGNFWTGLSDLLSIGSFTAASVYYGNEKGVKDWRPWTYGSIAALLYVVDLYGSYTGAKRYNQAQYRNLCGQVDLLYEQLY